MFGFNPEKAKKAVKATVLAAVGLTSAASTFGQETEKNNSIDDVKFKKEIKINFAEHPMLVPVRIAGVDGRFDYFVYSYHLDDRDINKAFDYYAADTKIKDVPVLKSALHISDSNNATIAEFFKYNNLDITPGGFLVNKDNVSADQHQQPDANINYYTDGSQMGDVTPVYVQTREKHILIPTQFPNISISKDESGNVKYINTLTGEESVFGDEGKFITKEQQTIRTDGGTTPENPIIFKKSTEDTQEEIGGKTAME